MNKEQEDIFTTKPQALLQINASNYPRPNWRSLIGGFFVEFVMGTFILWGTVGPYITSYFRGYSESVTLKETSLVYPITGVSASVARIIAKKIVDKVGFDLALRGSLVIMGLSYGIASFTQSLVPFVILYAVIPGFMGGVGTVLPVWASWEAAPGKRGLASGLTTAGFGFGSFLLSFLVQLIANPGNLPADITGSDGQQYFSSEVADRVPLLLRILSLFVLIFGLGGSLLITSPVKQQAMDDSTSIESEENYISNGQPAISSNVAPLVFEHNDKRNISFKAALRTKTVWVLAISVLFATMPLNFVSAIFKFYAENKPNLNNDVYLTALAATGSFISSFTKVGWGVWSDRTSFKFTFGVLILIEAITMSLLAVSSNSKVFYMLNIIIIWICFGGVYVLIPTVCSKIYGNKTGTQIYGVIDLFMSLGTVLQYFFMSIFLNLLSFDSLFYIMASLPAITLLLHIYLFREQL